MRMLIKQMENKCWREADKFIFQAGDLVPIITFCYVTVSIISHDWCVFSDFYLMCLGTVEMQLLRFIYTSFLTREDGFSHKAGILLLNLD